MIALFSLVVASCFCEELPKQPPYTQRLIAKEVLRLGGDVEAPSQVVFVTFTGKGFRDDHFEMLSHLEDLKWFSCRNVQGTAESLRYLTKLKKLQRLDIHGSGQVVEGLGLLTGSPVIEEVELTDLTLSHTALDAILALPKLRDLNIESVVVPSDSLEKLLRLSRQCEGAIDVTGLSESDSAIFTTETRKILIDREKRRK